MWGHRKAYVGLLTVVLAGALGAGGAGAQTVMGTGVFWGMLIATALGVFIIAGNCTFVEGLGRRRQPAKPATVVASPEGVH
jgi:hypothetical protein